MKRLEIMYEDMEKMAWVKYEKKWMLLERQKMEMIFQILLKNQPKKKQ